MLAGIENATLGNMSHAYLQSPEFTSALTHRTRLKYMRILHKIEPMYNLPVSAFDRAFVSDLRTRLFLKHKVQTTNDVLQVLSTIFSWGVLRGYAKVNAIKEVRRLKTSAKGDREVKRLQEIGQI